MAIAPSIIDTRRHQMFPTLEPADIARLRRFGQVRTFAKGDVLARVGEVGQVSASFCRAASRSRNAINPGKAHRSSRTGQAR
jgi:hypothetical protein